MIPHKGYLVSQISLTDVQDLLEARIRIEEATAGLAAERVSAHDLDALEGMARRDEIHPNETDEDRFAWTEHNKAFHVTIALAAGNRELVRTVDLLLDKASRVVFLYYTRASMEEARPDHVRIVAALRSRDPALARQAIREHITRIWQGALTILREPGRAR